MDASYGLLVKNKSDHTIVSSDVETPHFAGFADLISSSNASTGKIVNFDPRELTTAEIDQIAKDAVDLQKPTLDAKRTADAKAAGEIALNKSLLADGTSTSSDGLTTTIRQTNPNTGIVTTTAITKVTTVTNHPAVYTTDSKGKQVLSQAAYSSSSTKDVTYVQVSPTSVIQVAKDLSYASSAAQYDATIAKTSEDYHSYLASNNTSVKYSIAFNNIGNSFIHSYAVAGSEAIAPLFFINPASNAGDIHGVMRQYYEGGKWKIDIIQSGDVSRPPNVVVFKPISDLQNPANSIPNSSDPYGLVTTLANGAVAFDSRRSPLVIIDAIVAGSPEIPCNGGIAPRNDGQDPDAPFKNIAGFNWYHWEENKLDFDFKCNASLNSYALTNPIDSSSIMFCAPAVSAAVYSRIKKGFKDSKGQIHVGEGKWWVMYHQGFSVNRGSLGAGWCVYKSGFFKSATWGSGGTFGGSGGSRQEGEIPYPNSTINTGARPVLISDLSLYYP